MEAESYDDMCQMPALNQQAILNNLQARYNADQIFTYIGPTLLAVNPYRLIDPLFNEELTAQIIEDILKGKLTGPPHIYVIAGKAFHNMKNRQPKQSIIISGESGAGKTESTKYCMQMLTKLSHKKSHSIEKKILACNPLLEAFGNSKTVRNQNSSRFGKYVSILFGNDNTIKGAKIQNYLLEKSRVTMVSKNQRNFHVFYALTASSLFEVKPAENYAYLSNSNCYTANNINDFGFYQQIVQSFKDLGFAKEEQQKIWKLLIAILELGNIVFDDARHKDNEQNPCIITNKAFIPFLSSMLCVSAQKLEQMLLFKTKKILKEVHLIPIKKIDCQTNRDTLSKAIYNSIFQFIIDKIEIVLNPSNQEDNYEIQANFCEISILDIFGFENFQKNSMEQICINFTNEKLLAQYNQKVFESEINILKEDGLEDQISDIVPPSNMSIITRLAQIFNVINEQTPRPQFTEDNMIDTMRNSYVRSSEVMFELTNKKIFKINHSPCIVSYSIVGFKIKNQDDLTPQISDICAKILPNNMIEQPNRANKTILKKFRERIDELINKLSEGTNHFVRCIKPNEEKKSKFIHSLYMKTQIKYLGVFETIKIRKAIFPFRKLYEDFSRSYQSLFNESKGKTHREAAKIILNKINAPSSSFRFGSNRVYVNSEINEELQRRHQFYLQLRLSKAIIIQKRYRALHARQILRKAVKEIIKRNKTQKFEQKCCKILNQKKQYLLFMALHYIKVESEQKMKQIQEDNNNQNNSEESNHSDEVFPDRIPIQLPTSTKIAEKIENELAERTELLENTLIIKQQFFQNQKSRLQKQKQRQFQQMTTCILQLKQFITTYENQNKSLSDKLSFMQVQIDKGQEQLNELTTTNQKQKLQKQQLLQQKRHLLIELHMSNQIIEQYKTKEQQTKKLQKNLIQVQSENLKLEIQTNHKEEALSQDRNTILELQKKIKFLENIVRDYQIIINQYKTQKEAFFKQKQDLHKNILEKTLQIDELKLGYQSTSKNELAKKDLQIQKFKDKALRLEREVMEYYQKEARKSQDILELQLKLYENDGVDKDYSSAELIIKDLKIDELKQNLAIEKQKVAVLEEKEKKINKKLQENVNKHLKDVAEFNNKISMANQRSKRDHIAIRECKIKIASLKQQLKTKQTQRQHSNEDEIGEQQLVNFIRVYHRNMDEAKREQFKSVILEAIANK